MFENIREVSVGREEQSKGSNDREEQEETNIPNLGFYCELEGKVLNQ